MSQVYLAMSGDVRVGPPNDVLHHGVQLHFALEELQPGAKEATDDGDGRSRARQNEMVGQSVVEVE